jgi:hypothetical protein
LLRSSVPNALKPCVNRIWSQLYFLYQNQELSDVVNNPIAVLFQGHRSFKYLSNSLDSNKSVTVAKSTIRATLSDIVVTVPCGSDYGITDKGHCQSESADM